MDHRAGRAAGSEDQCRPGPLGPARRTGVEMGEEAVSVGIVAVQPAVLHPERVGRAHRARCLADLVEQGQHDLLVRHGDVAAGELPSAQPADESRRLGRRNIDALIAAGKAVLGEPMAMDQRRTGMRDGMADDEAALVHGSRGAGVMRRGQALGAPRAGSASAGRGWWNDGPRSSRTGGCRGLRADSRRRCWSRPLQPERRSS
jgi:hypothetical protein